MPFSKIRYLAHAEILYDKGNCISIYTSMERVDKFR